MKLWELYYNKRISYQENGWHLFLQQNLSFKVKYPWLDLNGSNK
jgi:hypothetical protein